MIAMDLVKTLEETDTVDYLSSENSADEDEAVPQKVNRIEPLKGQSAPGRQDFEGDFDFVDNQADYMKDTWSEVASYLKKKSRTTLNAKIAQVRQRMQTSTDDPHSEDVIVLSDDELVVDDLNMKKGDARRKARKRVKAQTRAEPPPGLDQEEQAGSEEEEDQVDDDDDQRQVFDDQVCLTNDEDMSAASFHTMNLSRPLLKATEALHFIHPTPIQKATIPLALAGRDICGCAATGTGKTAAYMLPILERLLYRPKENCVTRVLILVPTRELGVQVFQVSKQLAEFTTISFGLSVGGLDLKMQESSLRKSPDVVVATPGRLIDHLQNTPSFTLDSIEVLILDEADRMLDECFLEQMKEIVKSCCPTRQTLLFSATMTDQVKDLAAVSLKKPVKVFVDSNREVTWNLRQEFVRLRQNKCHLREAVLASLVCRTFRDHTMVFVRTKRECHRLHILLGLLGLRVAQLHGNMSQANRLYALKQFKEEEVDILLTTDVAARGLDITGVKTVINYELPNTVEQYIHRVGRTARAGRIGRSISLADEEHRKMVKEIIRSARDPVKNRVIPVTIVDKYMNKIKGMAEQVKTVMEEEQAEREIASLENKANRMENELKTGPEPERTFKVGKAGHALPMLKKKRKKGPTFETEEDKKLFQESQYLTRESKRSRKMKKIRTVHDAEPNEGGDDKRKKGKNIFDVSRKNVKRMRHEGSKAKREQRSQKRQRK
ncbi:hypothetical protein TCAL_00878 [Tigriopus californicus]|uniref:RNA helicase n=1 Tax=Tigriopus californicus TaxID=6832 RepID=A0A553NER9_TIGCA|nr:probable ATP-dependent RNA helicase DDX27 [Tigriopus californicus]TRY63930.1 hypothetical protein TCAL_00878 [Tigriopus californicus]|eukprot:TCALIF_00878-PA protein Name:"Similar to DDX27 Probable ATP-dependent RNA helicase DDX27 (Bos taurus)" AED:0.01 eAED:0.01 QI:155/1/1/1/1/1/2/891/719